MAAEENVLSFIDARGEVGRPSLVGVHFLHQRPVRVSDSFRARASLQAKDLISLLLSHLTTGRSGPPRCRVTLRVFTPAGLPAVKIRHQ